MTPIPIALCITELSAGGAERALTELAIRIRPTYQPMVYSLKPRPALDEKSCVPILEQAKIDVQYLNMTGFWSVPQAVSRLTAAFRRQKPAVVQSFLFHANILSRLAARRAGVSAVFSGIRVSEKDAPWRLFWDRMTEKNVHRHVCVSQSVADFSKTVAKLPAEKLVVIPNGIDTVGYDPHCNPPTNAGGSQNSSPPYKKAIVIGRLHQQKGVDWLLRYWPQVCEGWDLTIVGDGPERTALETQRQQLPADIRHTVHFLGWRSDIPALLQAADLLLLPSRWEGMPNVILQAMAARLPVLATRTDGVAELLGPNTEQQTWEMGNETDFVHTFWELSKHLKPINSASPHGEISLQHLSLGEENFRRVRKFFTLDMMVNRYMELWRDVTVDTGPTRR